jgi:uncharacterized integral membrane protein
VTMNKLLTLIKLIANLRFLNTEFYFYLHTKFVPLIVFFKICESVVSAGSIFCMIVSTVQIFNGYRQFSR